MPSYFSYIGKLNSPGFFWNDMPPEANSGNTPARVIPKEFSLGLGTLEYNSQSWSLVALQFFFSSSCSLMIFAMPSSFELIFRPARSAASSLTSK